MTILKLLTAFIVNNDFYIFCVPFKTAFVSSLCILTSVVIGMRYVVCTRNISQRQITPVLPHMGLAGLYRSSLLTNRETHLAVDVVILRGLHRLFLARHNAQDRPAPQLVISFLPSIGFTRFEELMRQLRQLLTRVVRFWTIMSKLFTLLVAYIDFLITKSSFECGIVQFIL